MEGLLADLSFTTDILNRLVAASRLTQDADLLFGCVSFALHCQGPFYAHRLTFQVAQFTLPRPLFYARIYVSHLDGWIYFDEGRPTALAL